MKRSEINKALREMEAVCAKEHCYLPPFCHFTPEQWQTLGHEYDEIRDCMLGWDITDYGLGDFEKVGFSLITIRNGNLAKPEKYPKVYAEKLLYLKQNQYSPNHFHWYKTEDIINRGGGNLLIRVYNSLPNEEMDEASPVTVHMDGRTYTVPAGTQVRLTPGESIHIQQGLYHDFEVEPGTGAVLLGEVSQCNDDVHDNRFNPPVGRFPTIEEDEPPYRLLCSEYPPACGFYGAENATVPARGEKYPGIHTPRELYRALSALWCVETCAPRMRDRWSPENPTVGQCSVTAFLAQDIFGGKVLGIPLGDGNVHCYNAVGNCVFDLTGEQFGARANELAYENNPEQFREVHFSKEEKRRRYERLCQMLADWCKNHS